MKKILLATTLLAATTGYAFADITYSGEATAGIAQNGTDKGGDADPNGYGKGDDEFLSYSSAGFAVTFAGQTDSGLTFGATFDLTAGVTYALADDDGFDAGNDGAFGDPSVFLSGTFGKITFSTDNLDGFDGDELSARPTAAVAAVPFFGGRQDDPLTAANEFLPATEAVAAVAATDGSLDGNYDVQYDGTFGAVSVGVLADMDSGLMAAKVGYTAGNLSLDASYAQQNVGNDDIYNVGVSYAFGMFTVSAATDNESDASITGAYDNGSGITASATYNTGTGSDDASFDLAGGYSANGLTVAASVDNVSEANNDIAKWTVTASYDLGGGLSVEAGTNYTMDVMVGAAMSF